VPLFVTACLSGRRPIVHGDGLQARDFTYVEDAVEANVLAARAPDEAMGRAFNVSGGARPISILELLGKIAERCGVDPDPDFAPARPGDIRRSEADVSLARRVLGFRPRTTVDDGLARTVEAFRAARGGVPTEA
jgi:nucleoside-diphosphate-sugar epimerase